jgi:hypothetical protein
VTTSTKATHIEETTAQRRRTIKPAILATNRLVEARYRSKLKNSFLELQLAVPTVRTRLKICKNSVPNEDLCGLEPAGNVRKCTTMAKATEYIGFLEKQNKLLFGRLRDLETRCANLDIEPAGEIENSWKKQTSSSHRWQN